MENKQRLMEIAAHWPIEVVYDCGSRDALDGLDLAVQTGAKELHVFECNPPSFEVCRANVAKAALPGVSVFLNDFAIKDEVGTVSFFPIDPARTVSPHAGGNTGASSLLKASRNYRRETYVQNEITVPATALDEYCKTHRPPDLLWMDLQGSELMALRGARATLKSVKVIHIEVSFRPMYVGQALFWDIDDYLRPDFDLAHLDLGRWPKVLPLYRLLKTGPWVVNAIYAQR